MYRCEQIVQFLNSQKDVYAFVPKIERWISDTYHKEYVVDDLYTNYIFIHSRLNQSQFNNQYKEILHTISLASMKDKSEITMLNANDQNFITKMFASEDIIRHSVGDIVNSKLVIQHGPLKGMEEEIKKIDRHKRIAFLQCHFLGKMMKVPLEIVSKS